MANKKISAATLSTPVGSDMLPIARAADTTARRVTVAGLGEKFGHINAKDYATGDGTTDDLAALQAAMTAAKASSHKRLYIPAGTYKIVTAGGIVLDFNGGVDNQGVEVFGEGMGKTIIKLASGTTLTGNFNFALMNSSYQKLHDLTFDGNGNGFTGSFTCTGQDINVLYNGFSQPIAAVECEVRRVEVKNLNGPDAAGASCFGCYTPWNAVDVDTTLSVAVSGAGAQWATPASMSGISKGRRLTVGTEDVVVSAVNQTQFYATFAGAQALNARVYGYCQGMGNHIFEDCYAHDCDYASGFLPTSSENRFVRCVAKHGGMAATQHAFYGSGGYNKYDSCHAEGWAGYHYHLYKQTPNMDTAGDIVVNCVSINPGFRHFHIGGINNALNPDFAVGEEMQRYQVIKGCIFRNTNGVTSNWGDLNHPTIVTDCVFEDTYTMTFNVPGIFSNNICRALAAGTNFLFNIRGIASNNYIFSDDAGTVSLFRMKQYSKFIGNHVALSGITNGRPVNIDESHVTIIGNTFILSGSSAYNVFDGWAADTIVSENVCDVDSYCYIWNEGIFNVPGQIINNNFDGAILLGAQTNYNVLIANNNVALDRAITYNTAQSYNCGKAIYLATSNAIEDGRLLMITGNTVGMLGTSDIIFFGVSATHINVSWVPQPVFVYYEVGSVLKIEADGAWVAGNVGVPSTSTGGMIHDSGATTAPATSYVVFLDSGSSGFATCLVMRTL